MRVVLETADLPSDARRSGLHKPSAARCCLHKLDSCGARATKGSSGQPQTMPSRSFRDMTTQ